MGWQTNASQSRCWLTQFAIFEEEAVWPVDEGPGKPEQPGNPGYNRAIGKCSLSNWSQVRYSEPLLSNGCPIKFVSHQIQTNFDIMQHKLCAIFSWKRNAKRRRNIYFTAQSREKRQAYKKTGSMRAPNLRPKLSATSSKGNNLYNETDFKFVMFGDSGNWLDSFAQLQARSSSRSCPAPDIGNYRVLAKTTVIAT